MGGNDIFLKYEEGGMVGGKREFIIVRSMVFFSWLPFLWPAGWDLRVASSSIMHLRGNFTKLIV